MESQVLANEVCRMRNVPLVLIESMDLITIDKQPVTVLTQEPVNGCSLREYVTNRDPLPLKVCLNLCKQMLDMCRTLSQLSILHGNINLDNLMIETKTNRVLINGIEIVRSMTSNKEFRQVTQSDTILPKEQQFNYKVDEKGSKQVTMDMDCYAMYTCMCELTKYMSRRDQNLVRELFAKNGWMHRMMTGEGYLYVRNGDFYHIRSYFDEQARALLALRKQSQSTNWFRLHQAIDQVRSMGTSIFKKSHMAVSSSM